MTTVRPMQLQIPTFQVPHPTRYTPVVEGGRVYLRAGLRCPTKMRSEGGVMDRPTKTKPGTEKKDKKDVSRRRPPIYRVLLHNDNFNKREYVVRVLLKVIEELTVDDAVNVMQEAHMSGLALVTACAQENAERYCQGLRNDGLTATMEPDNGPTGGSGA